MNFWQKLKKKKNKNPILALAPMADVTDVAFRKMIAKYGKPDVMWTEFVSADGLMSSGKKKLLHQLKFSPKERPVVAQLFSSDPEKMKKACALVQKLGFDGVDLNMGCPDRKIEKQGAGAALMKNPSLARELIRSAKKGASKIPVSVKTRVGYNSVDLENWLTEILQENPAVVTVHARTRKELSKVPANWKLVKKAVSIRNSLKSNTLIFGNGDVGSVEQAKKLTKETGADGVMVGRAIFGKPWFFKNDKEVSIKEKLRILVEHTKAFQLHLGKDKNFAVMKKHYKAYVSGFDGAKELRVSLMNCKTYEDVYMLINSFLKSGK